MKNIKTSLWIGLAVLAVILVSAWWFTRDRVVLPRGESEAETILVNEETGQVVTDAERALPGLLLQRSVMVTDGVRHLVPLDEIRGGGPPKDGIPSIDDPIFVAAAEADFIDDREPGLAFSHNEVDRFYPFQILVWHEIVNDVVGGQRVLITYCPLCLSGVVFDPLVQGERVEFGTSGKLWQSNLVMYDRKTDSLWSQILGESILGEMTGTRLTLLPSDQIRFGEWKAAHPDGQVLSRDTGAVRSYGFDPYGDYYTDDGQIISPVNASDPRLENKDFILGLVIDGAAKAYYPPAVKAKGEVVDTFAGITIVANYDDALDVVRLFEREPDGTLTRLNPFASFWFSWMAAHPDTELYN
ncbi:hypothetical protein CL628_01670 [bacterium]|nr:hypothetical protein [bacterium]